MRVFVCVCVHSYLFLLSICQRQTTEFPSWVDKVFMYGFVILYCIVLLYCVCVSVSVYTSFH